MTFIEFCAKRLAAGYKYDSFLCRVPLSKWEMLLRCFSDRFFLYNDCVVVFLRLDQENYDRLKNGLLNLTDPKVLLPLFRLNGSHVHVVSVVGSGVKSLKFLADYLMDKSLSWYRPDMSKLVVFERS